MKYKGTIAVSKDNFNFLNKLNISNLLKKEIWTCSNMKLYTESEKGKFSEIFELNKESKNQNIFYMIENSKIINLMREKIKKIKSISLIKNKKVSSIFSSGLLKGVKFGNNISKYNLIIICSGHNSNLIKNLFTDRIIKNSYKEFAITTVLQHKILKNNIARQMFLNNSIFAMLPISKRKTSIVWSIKDFMKLNSDFYFKKKIQLYASNYLKNIKFNSKLERKNLNLLIRKKYYLDRTLLFGDALHLMHPFIGQSFNMTLRDLKCLERILKEKINLGLDIGSSEILSDFTNETKPRNFSFSLGSDILKNMLSLKKPRNDAFKILNKSDFAKSIIFDIADKGLRF